MEPSDPRAHLGDLFELAAVALQALMLPLAPPTEAPRIQDLGPGRARPIVLVPGWGPSRSGLLLLQGYLSALGFDRVFLAQVGSADSLSGQAEALGEQIDRIAAACALARGSLDLVTHCTGGLAARLYLQELGGATRVDRCICLATPHLGSTSPYWLASPLRADLQPGSALLERLNDPAHRAPGVRYCSLWADLDLAIVPTEHAIYSQGETKQVHGVGHVGILYSPRVLQQVAHRLAQGQVLPKGRLRQAAGLAGRLVRAGNRLAEQVRTRLADTG